MKLDIIGGILLIAAIALAAGMGYESVPAFQTCHQAGYCHE